MIGVETPARVTAIPDPSDDGTIIEAYYDSGRKSYWIANDRGGWVDVNEQSLRKMLRAEGLRYRANEGENLSPVDSKMLEIIRTKDVVYAGPLAGHQSGLTECCGNRILVINAPKLIGPVSGDWPILRAFLESLLKDKVHDQLPYLYGWLKIAYEALRHRAWRPGQALGLAGPRQCGKSLLQCLITEILGGRAAKPYRYMTGQTSFNADLFGAEHLMIEDEHSSTDIRARRNLGAQIKQFTVNKIQSCHGKNRQALSLSPFWRVSISVNDEPEAMMVLPPMSDSDQDSLSDKLFLLRALKADMPMPTEAHAEYEAFWQTLMSELPAFIYHLEKYEIPIPLRDGRFGIKTWHHPELLSALDSLSPETRLLALIDQVIFNDDPAWTGARFTTKMTEWAGTAEELERLLIDSVFKTEAQRLLSFSTAAGTYLGRLARKQPKRVEKDRGGDSRRWVICGPKAGLEIAA